MTATRTVSLALMIGCSLAPKASAQDLEVESSYAAPQDGAPTASVEEFQELVEAALLGRYDTERAARVEGLVIEKDAGRLELDGWVFRAKDVAGMLSSATFFGEGRFTLEPPIPIERQQVRRFLGSERIDVALERASLSFNGVEDELLFRGLDYTEEQAEAAAEKLEPVRKWIKSRKEWAEREPTSEEERARRYSAHWTALGLYERKLAPDRGGDFSAAMTIEEPEERDKSRVRLASLTFSYSPHALEEVSVLGVWDLGARMTSNLITTFAASDEYRGRFKYAATSPALEGKAVADVDLLEDELVLRLSPGKDTDIRMRSVMKLEVLREGLQILNFGITTFLGCTAAELNGEAVEFVHPSLPWSPQFHAPAISLLLPRPARAGDVFEVALELEGKILDDYDGYTWIVREEDDWFPNPSTGLGLTTAMFDTTLITPKDFTAVSNGVETACRPEHAAEGDACYRFVTRHPIDFTTFNIGRSVQIERGTARDGTPIAVYTNPESLVEFSTYAGVAGYKTHLANLSKTAPALVNKAKLAHLIYSDWFGPFPYGRLALSPHPKGHGRGSASLLLLAQDAFLTATDRDAMSGYWPYKPWSVDAFISHEVAHQWWGGAAGIRGTRDQWFSEGFADYASVVYLEHLDSVNGTDWSRGELAGWHEALTREDGYVHEVAPLALGFRVNSEMNRAGFEAPYFWYVYNKGGFVMHMLRTHARYLTGDPAAGDALFKKAIREFIDAHYLGHPSTLDMQKSLGRSFGTNLSWFFKQWVYGTGIPKLRFSHELTSHPDGGTLLRGRIVQRQDGDAFRFPVAVYVRLGKGKDRQEAHFYQWIESKDASFEVGPLPWRPDEVSLNDDFGVLAIVEDVPWEPAATGQ